MRDHVHLLVQMGSRRASYRTLWRVFLHPSPPCTPSGKLHHHRHRCCPCRRRRRRRCRRRHRRHRGKHPPNRSIIVVIAAIAAVVVVTMYSSNLAPGGRFGDGTARGSMAVAWNCYMESETMFTSLFRLDLGGSRIGPRGAVFGCYSGIIPGGIRG